MTFWNATDIDKAKNNLTNFHQGLKSNVYSTPEAQSYQKELIDLLEEVFKLDSSELLLTLNSKYHLLKGTLLEEFGNGYFAQYPNFHNWNQPVYDVPYLKTYILEIKSLPHFYQGKSIANYQKKYGEIQKLKSELETITSTTLAEAQTATSEIVSLANTKHSDKTLTEIVDYFTTNYEEMMSLDEVAKNHLSDIQSKRNDAIQKEKEINAVKTTVESLSASLNKQFDVQKENFATEFLKLTKSNQDIEKQKQALQKLSEEVLKLQEQTKAELRNALDIATFKEFDSVAKEKDKTRGAWFSWFIWLTIIIFGLSITISWWQGWFNPETTKSILTSYTQPWQLFAFYGSKLVVLPPLLGLAYFFLQRYLKESRIAEEYRFKATCALHFNSYIELVQKINIPDKADEVYRTFLIAQIKELFTSPTDKIYKNSNLSKGGELKAVSDTLELFVPQLTKIKGLLNSATGDHDNENKPS